MAASPSRPHAVVGVLAFAGTVAAVMQTLVTPLLGELPRILHTSSSNASWVVTATLLSAAVCVPVSGRLGDLYGKRRMLLVCCVPLLAGSIVCALASSLWPMLAGRALQGMGMGLVPLGISLLRDTVPARRLGSAISLVSASMGIGGGLGLPLSAAVAEYADWRALFWGSAALTALVAALIWFLVPVPEHDAFGGRFDPVGALGLGTVLVCLLLPVSKGADWGWDSPLTLGLLAVAAALLPVWGLWELRSADPLVDLRVTARPRVLLTNAASVLIGFAMYAQMLIIPQLMQLPAATGYGLGRSMLEMGLWLAPSGLTMMAVSPLGGRLSAARGPKTTLISGVLIIAFSYGASLALLDTAWGLMLVTVVCSAGVGLAYGAMPALIMSAVPSSETASANSFNTLMRSLGTSASAAVVGVVLSQMTITLGGVGLPSEDGFRTGLVIGCGVSLLAALVATAIPGARRAEEAPEPEESQAPAAV